MSTVPSRQQVIALYREFMRNSTKFNNYNFKHYFVRRSRDAFKESKNLKDETLIAQSFQKARENLKILERQSKISQMYSFEKLVVEPLQNNNRSH